MTNIKEQLAKLTIELTSGKTFKSHTCNFPECKKEVLYTGWVALLNIETNELSGDLTRSELCDKHKDLYSHWGYETLESFYTW